jgi:hypothetical protein
MVKISRFEQTTRQSSKGEETGINDAVAGVGDLVGDPGETLV